MSACGRSGPAFRRIQKRLGLISEIIVRQIFGSVVALEVRMQELLGRPAAVPCGADPTVYRRAARSSAE